MQRDALYTSMIELRTSCIAKLSQAGLKNRLHSSGHRVAMKMKTFCVVHSTQASHNMSGMHMKQGNSLVTIFLSILSCTQSPET